MLRLLTLAVFLLFALLSTMTVADTEVAIPAPQSIDIAATIAATSTGIITVTTTNDEVNIDSDCSLRDALQAAAVDAVVDGCPAGHGADVIILPQGIYSLTLGQLEITGTVTISGSTTGPSILDGNQQSRVLYIDPGANVTLAYLDTRNGQAPLGSCCDDAQGGGTANSASTSLTHSALHSNADCCDYGDGGGIANYGNALLTHSVVQGNHAGSDAPTPYATYGGSGGGIFNSGVLTVTSSTISGNQAGPGFYSGHGGETPHCTGGAGGGIANSGLLRVENSTITKNAPGAPECKDYTGEGGGIYSDGGARGGTIRNSIVNDNQIDDCAGAYITSLGYNLFQTIERCFLSSMVSTDKYWAAYLGPLKNNGGPTLTHALDKKSPAIDAGACTDSAGITVTVDQRDKPRRQGGGCDIGAFESPYTATFAIREVSLPLITHQRSCTAPNPPCLLTNDPAYNRSPSWSPDGSRIAFVKKGTANNEDGIYVMNADGAMPIKIADQGEEPIWSPDGSKIAFLAQVGGDTDIFVMDADGSHLTNVSNTPAEREISLAWSPDSSKILFGSNDGNICCYPRRIHVMNADGSQKRLLAANGNVSSSPWSPDSSRIIYGDNTFHIVNMDGSNSITLTSNAPPIGAPAWSPSGQKIAFACRINNLNLQSNICIMNSDGSQQTDLITDGLAIGDPIWSPDSSKLLFQHSNELAIITVAGGAPIPLTSPPLGIFFGNPVWSPDSRKIAFASAKDDPVNMILINTQIFVLGVGE